MILYFAFLLLFLWLLHFVIRKIGFYERIESTGTYQTNSFQKFLFISKIYLYPLIRKKRTDGKVKKLSVFCNLLSSVNIFAFWGVLIGAAFLIDNYYEYFQLENNELKSISGKVVKLSKVSGAPRSTSYSLHLEVKKLKVEKFNYLNSILDEDFMKKFNNEMVTIEYYESTTFEKELVSIIFQNNKYGTLKSNLEIKINTIKMLEQWLGILFMFVITAPWFRYFKCGLVKFVY